MSMPVPQLSATTCAPCSSMNSAARNAGLTDDEIWDVGAIRALFAMSNRLAHLTALRPNPEFFRLGRVPRQNS